MNVKLIKERFKPEMRVELLNMNDIQAPPIGTLGTIMHVDDIGTIHVKWDNGSTLGVVLTEDSIKIIR